MKAKNTTVDAAEIAHFSAMANEWWDERGKFAPLHRMNPARISFIRKSIEENFSTISGLRLLDVGCGGGLIAEPMARLGANVTAIDASEKNIEIAKAHSATSGLSIDYQCTSVEDLSLNNNELFDVILALEIVEHVANLDLFIDSMLKLLTTNGLLIISTLNRTAKSYALAIVGAEYVLRWLPIGTHNWKKFLRPSELCNRLEQSDMEIVELMGMSYNPFSNGWRLEPKDLEVNYLLTSRKHKI